MEFKENDYVVGMWRAEKENGDDWMMTIIKRDNKFLGEYRFRYVTDNKVFSSDDRKSFYSIQIPDNETEDSIIEKINTVFFPEIKKKYNVNPIYLEIKGDMNKFLFKIAQQPWAHVKHVNTTGKTEEEIQKEMTTDEDTNEKRSPFTGR